MSDKKETSLKEYFIAALLGGILTGPGGLFLSPLILSLVSRSKRDINYKSKWTLWFLLGIFPFVITFYASFVLSRADTYTKEVKQALNDQAQKCRASDYPSEGGPKLILVNSLYKTYIPDSNTYLCPLTNEEYLMDINQDGNELIVSSPIDEPIIESHYFIFSFKALNHGVIKDGRKSWE